MLLEGDPFKPSFATVTERGHPQVILYSTKFTFCKLHVYVDELIV